LLSLGVYPEVSLKQAHDRRDECRRQLANGIDPGVKRKVEKASEVDSFEAIAREWFEKFSVNWAPTHSSKVIRRLEMDVFPWLGSRRARDIVPPELLACLRRVESRGALDTAHRVLQNCGQIFRYAVATGRAERDPAADLRGALPPPNGGHFASITEPVKIGALQAVAILRELHASTGDGKYLFPSVRSAARPMSDNTLNAALRRLGYTTDDMTAHGFRSMASTLLNEQGCWNRDAIERQLAHGERDEVRAAYNYAEYLPERRKMMQAWADYLDSLRAGANVVPMKRAG